MLINLFRKRRRPRVTDPADSPGAGERAGILFDRGFNCTQAVLQATTGRCDAEFLALSEGFGGGIGDSGCLCGALSGGVMALGLSGKANRANRLMTDFKETFQTSCCRGLSKDHKWLSKEHLSNCRRITVLTATMVENLLKK